jgi:hypothetical protein
MATITPNVALILAADKLVNAISGAVLKTSVTEDAITQLMAIYCTQALASSDAVSTQRVLSKLAAMHRNLTKASPAGSQRVVTTTHGWTRSRK